VISDRGILVNWCRMEGGISFSLRVVDVKNKCISLFAIKKGNLMTIEFDRFIEKTYGHYKTMDGFELNMDVIKTGAVKMAWDAARDEAAKIAWEYARGMRKPSHTGTTCDDIVESILEL